MTVLYWRQITSQMPNHPANSFYYPRLEELPPIASIKITRQSRSPNRQTPMSNHILPNSISQRFSGKTTGSAEAKHLPWKDTKFIALWHWFVFHETYNMVPLPPVWHLYNAGSMCQIEPALASEQISTFQFCLYLHVCLSCMSLPWVQQHHWTVKCLSGRPGVYA